MQLFSSLIWEGFSLPLHKRGCGDAGLMQICPIFLLSVAHDSDVTAVSLGLGPAIRLSCGPGSMLQVTIIRTNFMC